MMRTILLTLFLTIGWIRLTAEVTPQQAAALSQEKTICLNMIVKNEKDVIERCLASVLPIIDYWVIVDTGSTDGTQKIIKDFMAAHKVSGELHERVWKNFSHNRNEALELAKGKGDYIFFIDADEYMVFDPNFKLPPLDKDYYYMTMFCYGTEFGKMQLICNHLDWKWVGVLHEVLEVSPTRSRGADISNVKTIYTTEGARSKDALKFQKDAEILEAGLKEEPNNARYYFYLAQSYRNARNFPAAIQNYQKRVDMGGWAEEVFISLLEIAKLQEELKEPKETVIKSYVKAFSYRPSRSEALYHLANYYRGLDDFKSAYKIAQIGTSIPPSKDLLFVEKWAEIWGLPLELSVSAYWIGHYQECKDIAEKLLKTPDLPEDIITLVNSNLAFANSKIIEEIALPSSSTQP